MTLHRTATIPTSVSSIPSHVNPDTDTGRNTPTGSKKGNVVPLTVGVTVTAGVIVIAVSAVILSVVIVLLLKRHKMRSAGFVQLASNEVEI